MDELLENFQNEIPTSIQAKCLLQKDMKEDDSHWKSPDDVLFEIPYNRKESCVALLNYAKEANEMALVFNRTLENKESSFGDIDLHRQMVELASDCSVSTIFEVSLEPLSTDIFPHKSEVECENEFVLDCGNSDWRLGKDKSCMLFLPTYFVPVQWNDGDIFTSFILKRYQFMGTSIYM